MDFLSCMDDSVRVISFDEEGNVNLVQKTWDIDEFTDFSYRYLLNEWIGRDYQFVIGSNGICTENFFEDLPWQIGRKSYKTDHIYWWGEDLIKKIEKHRPDDEIIKGACPFVYTKEIYTRTDVEPYLQAIFLPKTDGVDDVEFPVSTQLNLDYEKRLRLQKTIFDLDWVDPLFICAPYDVEYYSDMLPRDRLFSLGEVREDNEWNDRLLSVIQHCDTLYFQMVSTPAVFASYVGKKVKFYDTDILHYEVDDCEEFYTLDKTKKSKIYLEFIEYINEVFETKSSDMDFWIRKFLSLDRIMTPEKLAEYVYDSTRSPSLPVDSKRTGDIINMVYQADDILNKEQPLFPYLKHHVAKFNRRPSDLAVYYFNLL